jgi:nanoRNase/pAp phosphatase (c-di-AMP/oligoRNAs hydrolase)
MPRTSGVTLNGKTTFTRRSDRFLAGLSDFDFVTFVSHVNPDPDALGSMLGLAYMVETCLGKSTRLTRDGQIFRAENKAMVDLLDIKLEPIDEVKWREHEALVMVDSQPNTGRHSIDQQIPIYAVIDHHQTPGSLDDIQFQDIRMGIGATCSLVTRYLIEQDLNIPMRVATALYYGIETELSGYPREASSMDDSALQFLYPLTDHDLIAQIRNARLPLDYFDCILTALQSSFIYDNLIISWVNDMPQPELAAQVVDFMIRFEKIDWAVCAGVCGNQLILSVRTAIPNAQSGEMLRHVADKLGGRAGGHDRRAGGFIPLASTASSAIEQVQGELRRSLLKALRIDECRGQRLVPVREQLENLQT